MAIVDVSVVTLNVLFFTPSFHRGFVYFNWAIEGLMWILFFITWLTDPGYVDNTSAEQKTVSGGGGVWWSLKFCALY